jgi:hypothetical protein
MKVNRTPCRRPTPSGDHGRNPGTAALLQRIDRIWISQWKKP